MLKPQSHSLTGAIGRSVPFFAVRSFHLVWFSRFFRCRGMGKREGRWDFEWGRVGVGFWRGDELLWEKGGRE